MTLSQANVTVRAHLPSGAIPSTVHTPARFGAALRERRRALNITQAQLAGVTGMSRKAVIEIENGKPTAQWQNVLLLAQALGLDVHLQPR
ncbi:MAG: helix-turn-helix domain-containing protein [Baekduia sp.]